jgi:tRNA 2-thiouridine synthesizing protein A
VAAEPADLDLDCRGLRCPMPVIELSRHIDQVGVGRLVALAADDPAARPDIQAWCRMKGHEYAGEQWAADGTPVYLVRRLG